MELNNKPQPFPSWVWDDLSQDWVAPNEKSVPTDGKPYKWNEETQDWVEVIFN